LLDGLDVTSDSVETRIRHVLDSGDEGDSTNVLTDGYARALQLDSERLELERRITGLAARADDRDAAQDLRRAWLRHRTVCTELRELRSLLRRLKAES
jgi:hypothetical protein